MSYRPTATAGNTAEARHSPIPGGYRVLPSGKVASPLRENAAELPRPARWKAAPGPAPQPPSYHGIPAAEPVALPAGKRPGTRRLRDIPREEHTVNGRRQPGTRQLESRLHHLRKVHHWTDAAISAELNLREEDLDALAATAGDI